MINTLIEKKRINKSSGLYSRFDIRLFIYFPILIRPSLMYHKHSTLHTVITKHNIISFSQSLLHISRFNFPKSGSFPVIYKISLNYSLFSSYPFPLVSDFHSLFVSAKRMMQNEWREKMKWLKVEYLGVVCPAASRFGVPLVHEE